jgi:aminoglycoside 3-N-acetyltransferase
VICDDDAMREQETIGRVETPATFASLAADLRALGLAPGMTVMVHSSLSRLGYVSGGAQAVVQALLEAVGSNGTVMMPTHSGDLSDPAAWSNPPVPSSWWEVLRAEMPAFDPLMTPTRSMGAIVECFRHAPGLRRSAHPTVSAAATGPNANALLDGHELAYGLGESSPQARLYYLDGHILLLGVTHSNNTSLHLAEHRAAPPDAATAPHSSPVVVEGRRQWTTYANLIDDDSDFDEIGDEFDKTGRQRTRRVGAADARLMRARDIVDFAVGWMATHRTWTRQPRESETETGPT